MNSGFVFAWVWGLLPLVLVVVALVLLKRVADALDRLEGTLDRRLLRIQQALDPTGAAAEVRWPPEE
jgi:hypothetical protein